MQTFHNSPGKTALSNCGHLYCYYLLSVYYRPTSWATLLCYLILSSQHSMLQSSLLSLLLFSRSVMSNYLDSMNCSMPGSLSFTMSQSLLKLVSIESVMPSNHPILCHLLLLLPSTFPSIRVFSNESALHTVASLLEFQLQHQSFQCLFRVDFLQD